MQLTRTEPCRTVPYHAVEKRHKWHVRTAARLQLSISQAKGMGLILEPSAPTLKPKWIPILRADRVDGHEHRDKKKRCSASRICVSSFRRGHANLLCIDPILVYVLPWQAQDHRSARGICTPRVPASSHQGCRARRASSTPRIPCKAK